MFQDVVERSSYLIPDDSRKHIGPVYKGKTNQTKLQEPQPNTKQLLPRISSVKDWSPLLLGEVPDCEGACCVTRGLTPPSRSIVTTPNTEKTHSPLIQVRKRRLEQE